MKTLRRSFIFILGLLAVLSGCTQNTATSVVSPPESTAPQLIPSATSTLTRAAPAETPTLSPTATTLPSPTSTPALQVCSPLEGIGLGDLSAAVSNPFNPPSPGSDDPHQGVDLADRLPGSISAVTGKPVLAALGGQVAGVIRDRFPYGNAVIIETPLDSLGTGWEQALSLPTPLPQPLTNPALTCPPIALPYSQTGQRSVYLLYAHMLDAPSVQAGQELNCGEAIGTIGQSGNALNPHLHIEARVGPSGSRFGSLAHYDNRATAEEMGLYCLWRVSGAFQLLDPLVVLKVTEK